MICRCTPVNFALRTPAEQQALVGAFGAFLNATTAPVQLVVRAVPIDLTDQVAALSDAAGGLPHPALETAAREHARFLSELADRADLLRRDLLLVLQEPAPAGSSRRGDRAGLAGRLARRAEQAATALAAAGVRAETLDGAGAAAVLTAAADPDSQRPAGLAAPDAVITTPTGASSEEFPWSTD